MVKRVFILLFVFLSVYVYAEGFGSLALICDSGFSVTIGNVNYGETTTEEQGKIIDSISVGSHSLTITKDGYLSQNINFFVQQGKTTVLRIVPQSSNFTVKSLNEDVIKINEEKGDIIVRSLPVAASVYINNQKIGLADLEISDFTAGTYKIRFEQNGKTIESDFILENADSLNIMANFLRNEVIIDSRLAEERRVAAEAARVAAEAARNRVFREPEYVNTPLGRIKVYEISYNRNGTLDSVKTAQNITITIPQGKITGGGNIIFGENNIPLSIESPVKLEWDKYPDVVKIRTKMTFWENGIIQSVYPYYPDTEFATPVGKFCTGSRVFFHDNGVMKRYKFQGWEILNTPVGKYMIGSMGFNKQGGAEIFSFSENNSFYIDGKKYKRNVTLKISPSGTVIGEYRWDSESMEWKPK